MRWNSGGAILGELQDSADPGETAWDALTRMQEDQAIFHDCLRPFARPGETMGQTFERLMNGLKVFLRGLAGI